MIGIRADGNSQIGTGHIMRCLSIAEQIKQQGNEVIFLLADSKPQEMIKSRGFATKILDTDWQQLEEETDILHKVVKNLKISMLLIDTYYVTPQYLLAVRDFVKTAYIDDLNKFDYPVDILINYASYGKDMKYNKFPNTKYYIGTEYAPLRSQFQNIEVDISKKNMKILVLSGGTDPYHMTDLIPQALMKCESLGNYKFMVVEGVFAKTSDATAHSERVEIYHNIQNMASLMEQADIAISAGGTTLYELCACKLPTVTYSFVDNQLDNVKAFDRLGVFPYAGDLRDGIDTVIDKTVFLINKLIVDDIKNRIDKMSELVDGNGAFRIAKLLCE